MLDYWFTLVGLYFELIGAFLLAIEAIGSDNLLKFGQVLKKKRITSVIIYILVTLFVLLLTKIYLPESFLEAFILIFSLGILVDFAPKIFTFIIKRAEKGTSGFVGFIIFSLGFLLQAFVNLSQLRQ